MFLTIVQTIFTNSLNSQLSAEFGFPKAAGIIAAGANGIREVVSGADLEVVLNAYAVSVNRVFYVGLASSIGVFAFAWGMGWHDLRSKNMQLPGMGGEEGPAVNEKPGEQVKA